MTVMRIDRDRTRELIEQGAQLVEVLPSEEYERFHLPGAVSIPLDRLAERSVDGLRRDLPVVVYCADYQ